MPTTSFSRILCDGKFVMTGVNEYLFCANGVICWTLWRHLSSLPYQFSIFKDVGGWQPWNRNWASNGMCGCEDSNFFQGENKPTKSREKEERITLADRLWSAGYFWESYNCSRGRSSRWRLSTNRSSPERILSCARKCSLRKARSSPNTSRTRGRRVKMWTRWRFD